MWRGGVPNRFVPLGSQFEAQVSTYSQVLDLGPPDKVAAPSRAKTNFANTSVFFKILIGANDAETEWEEIPCYEG